MSISIQTIFQRIREERIRLNHTQDQMAEFCQCGKATYVRWEKNVFIPADKLQILSMHGFDIGYIISGHRSETETTSELLCKDEQEREVLLKLRQLNTDMKAAITTVIKAL